MPDDLSVVTLEVALVGLLRIRISKERVNVGYVAVPSWSPHIHVAEHLHFGIVEPFQLWEALQVALRIVDGITTGVIEVRIREGKLRIILVREVGNMLHLPEQSPPDLVRSPSLQQAACLLCGHRFHAIHRQIDEYPRPLLVASAVGTK